MSFEIIRSNITSLPERVGAIVNTANPHPLIGSGTDMAIYKAAGSGLMEARLKIGDIESGHSAITPAFNLNADYIIHSVGPQWQGGNHGEEEILYGSYVSALNLAYENGCESIAFPLMASGNCGFPKATALSVANRAIGDFLLEKEIRVILVVLENDAFRLSVKLQHDIQSFIDDYHVESAIAFEYSADHDEIPSDFSAETRRSRLNATSFCCSSSLAPSARPLSKSPAPHAKKNFSDLFSEYTDIDELLDSKKESFSEALIRIIDENGWKDSDVYKRAGMDKKLFNKIINVKNYHTSKSSALSLAIALRLNLDETRDFIGKAGYALTETSDSDLIVAYFINKKQYDCMLINEVLFSRDLPIL